MTFNARVFRVFIASPSDLTEERDSATEVINDWNAQHAAAEGVVLLPVRWETHARPQSGIRPQQAINDQLVSKCDILLGMFWTRVGTSTGVAESGTIEEFDQFVAASKPALLYFSRRPIDPARIDARQHAKLKAFKKQTLTNALVGEFATIQSLKDQLLRNLTDQVRELKVDKPKRDRLEQQRRMTELFKLHKDENISPEEFAKFSEQMLGPKRSKAQTSDPIKPGETGPNGHPIIYLKNGDKVEVLPNDEDPHGEPWHMILRRNDKDLLAAREEFWEKVWWNRHMIWLEKLASGEGKLKEAQKTIFATARKAARRIERKYGKKNLGWDTFDWGMVNGKLSALNWVLGDEWDFLDT
ncbi:hypothetical protein ACVWXO_001253 [Bradyrhizobium sp. LM2.7]